MITDRMKNPGCVASCCTVLAEGEAPHHIASFPKGKGEAPNNGSASPYTIQDSKLLPALAFY